MRRTTFKVLGFGCVAAGLVGAVLPILPSTIFFILAAACFARSSPELEARILTHPTFGPSVRSWRDHGVVPVKAKLFAASGMALGYLVFYLTTDPGLWLAIAVAAFMLGCAIYVVSRPSRPRTDPQL